MTIRVKYFASLRETMGRVEENLVAEGLTDVAAVWRAVDENRPMPDRLLCAVNHEYATPAGAVQDGDEVAFFPPVTGG